MKPSRFHRCSSWVRLSCPLLCNDSPGVETVQETVEVPQLQFIDKGSTLLSNAVTSSSSSRGVGGALDSVIDKLMTLSRQGVKGFFGGFYRHF